MKEKDSNIKLVAFDLDGTLLNDNRKISLTDNETLNRLSDKGIIRVAATGRNLLSLNRVIDKDSPIDYAVFSSGAGIINWRTQEVNVKHNLHRSSLIHVIELFQSYNLSFTLHEAIPNSHIMHLHINDNNSHDLKNYVSFYKDYVSKFESSQIPEHAAQIIGLLNHKKHLYYELKSKLKAFKCVLTTSPVNQKSLWIEIFSPKVSKAKGIEWIMDQHGILNAETFSIGNDFNDIDMLKFTDKSFVVSNANTELLNQFKSTLSNNESGFSAAINKFI